MQRFQIKLTNRFESLSGEDCKMEQFPRCDYRHFKCRLTPEEEIKQTLDLSNNKDSRFKAKNNTL